MHRYLLIFVILSVVPVCARPLSYTEALDKMFGQHGGILASEKTVEQYASEKRAAFGLHLPTVTLGARYTHMNDDLALKTDVPLPPLIPGVTSFPIDYRLQDQNFYRVNAEAVWPIFTGGEIRAANKAAKSRYDASVTDLDITKNDMAYELTDKYFGLQLAIEAAQMHSEICDALRQHYENTVSRERVGMVPRVESMHAEVSLNNAVRVYNQARKDIEIAGVALRSLIILDSDPEPLTPLFVLDPMYMESLDYFIETVEISSPQANKIDLMQSLARAGRDAKRSTYTPDIYLFGNYEFYKHDLTMLEPEWYVGIGAQWKIFEGLTGHHNYIAASKAEQSVALKSTQAKRDLSALVEVYYKQILKAYEKYESSKGTLDFTVEYVRVRTKAFESGFATSVDVVDANTALSKNRLDMLSAAYEFDTALSRLLSLTGEYAKFEIYMNHPNAEALR